MFTWAGKSHHSCGVSWRTVIAVAICLVLAVSTVGHAAAIPFGENLGNFPDAIAITAEFDTFSGLLINGDTINATGFLFHLANSSFGDGFHSSFEVDPDGNFAVNDVLTVAAAAALDGAQSFGMYAFGAGLPAGAGAVVSAPAGFVVNPGNVVFGGLPEINFVIMINPALGDGLIFDTTATGISPIFTNNRFGSFDFFISTPAGFNPVPIDIATEMAWDANGLVTTQFTGGPFNGGTEVRPRGQLGIIPEPSVIAMLIPALGLFLSRRRRRVM